MQTENLEVMRDAVVGGDLRVEGMLEAPNIKGFLKGMFRDEAALVHAYPRPLCGWAALVGRTLPADVFLAEDGVWHATGLKGGAPVITETSSAASLAEETALRRRAVREIYNDMFLSMRLRHPVTDWELGNYISLDNHVRQQSGYRMSAPIRLAPGETIQVTLDNGGLAFPIALVADDQAPGWHDLPFISTDLEAGSRVYRYSAAVDTSVIVSCLGEPEDIAVWRSVADILPARLLSASGAPVSGTRHTRGGRLMPDGSVADSSGYGATPLLRVAADTALVYNGYIMPSDTDTHVIALFYDYEGNLLQGHYAGRELDDSRMVRHEVSDAPLRLHLILPSRTCTARFGYDVRRPLGVRNHPFFIERV